MTTERNDPPADSRDRLANISHYFLSESATDDNEQPRQQPIKPSNGTQLSAGGKASSGLLIEDVRVDTRDMLRSLVTRSLADYPGLAQILDPALPCEGSPMLALDDDDQPVLVVVATDDGQQALLAGLSALQEVKRSRAWLVRLYPSLSAAALSRSLRLMMVVRELPSGASCLAARCRFISFCTFRVLRLDGKTGVVIDEHPVPPSELAEDTEQVEGDGFPGDQLAEITLDDVSEETLPEPG